MLEYKRITIKELISVLELINKEYGNIPILTYNLNDCSVVSDYILSESMDISVREIVSINDIIYIKDRDYEKWLSDNVDKNEVHFVEIISKRHPELSGVAKKILLDEFIDEEWEENWALINPILNHYYLNDLDWNRVVLMINY